MPDRILRERICASATIADLIWAEEVLFYRLIVQADDFGRFDARPAVVRANCYQLQLDSVTDAEVRHWLDRLAEVDLVRVYEQEGRPYLQITQWTRFQRTRAQTSKYPDPPSIESTCPPALTSADIRQPPLTSDNKRGQMPPEAEAEAEAYSNAKAEFDMRNAEAETKADEPPPAPPPDLPDELQDFDKTLRRLRGYQPTPEFYAWVRETCVDIDLRAEAIKMVDHARRKGLAGNLKFITGWLEKAVNPPWEDAAPTSRSRANLVGPVSPPAAPRPLPPPKPELPPDEQQRVNAWKLALERIQAEMRDQDFRSWFRGTRLLAAGPEGYVIEADAHQLPWLEKSRAKIARALGIDQEQVEIHAQPVPVGASP
jgi:hypothetical protein